MIIVIISTETIDHLISRCTILAPNEYKNRRNRVGQYIYWKSVTIIILKHPTYGMSINSYLLWIPQR